MFSKYMFLESWKSAFEMMRSCCFLRRYEATDMNIYRSALSASVMSNLPNIREYVYPHRDQLMEEKRRKMLAPEQQNATTRAQVHQASAQHAVQIL